MLFCAVSLIEITISVQRSCDGVGDDDDDVDDVDDDDDDDEDEDKSLKLSHPLVFLLIAPSSVLDDNILNDCTLCSVSLVIFSIITI